MDEKVKQMEVAENVNVAEQLNTIHSCLVDKEKFIPYDYRMLVGWGVLSAVLFMTFDMAVSVSMLYGILYAGVLAGFGFLSETYLVKRINSRYDLKRFTKTQTFINVIYVLSILFSLLLTVFFAFHGNAVYAYFSWIVLLGFATYTSGFVINHRKFMITGILNLTVGLALFAAAIVYADSIPLLLAKCLSVVTVSGGFIYLGFNMRREYGLV